MNTQHQSNKVLDYMKNNLLTKKQIFKELRTKYISLTGRNARAVNPKINKNDVSGYLNFSASHLASNQSELISLNKQSKIYEKEEKILRSRLLHIEGDYEQTLVQKNAQLESKLDFLIKQNKQLSFHRSLSPKTKPKSQKNDSENLLKDLQFYQNIIQTAEQGLEENKEKIRQGAVEIQKLAKKHEKLKQQNGEKTEEKFKSSYEDLKKKYTHLKGVLNSSLKKLESIIKEKENEASELKSKLTYITSKYFKQVQQNRLMDISEHEYLFFKKIGDRHLSPEILYPDVDFLRRPSIKALYHT